jgi:hypothetical protein
MWNIQDDIVAGYLDENSAAKLHESIRYILHVIRKARPFRYLDLKAEEGRCESIFCEENVRRINFFLKERAKHALKTDRIFSRPNSSEMKELRKEQTRLDEYISTLDYYYKLGQDMVTALDFGKGFARQVASLEKRDETHLIICAMKCIELAPFSRWSKPLENVILPSVEYLALPKKPGSENFVVGKRMVFTRFIDFLITDFFEGLHLGHYPQICENCGRYYLKRDARFQKYCTRIDPNDRLKRTCQAVAAAKGRDAKERHPLKAPFTNRLSTICTHVRRGKLTKAQAKIAKQIARDRYDMAMTDPVYAEMKYFEEIGQNSVYKAAGIKL